jgi:hypothetical protein
LIALLVSIAFARLLFLGVYLMRMVSLLTAAAILLSACATDPKVKAGGQADGRYNRGTVGVGWPF